MDALLTGVDVLELLRGIRRFATSYAFNLPGQVFIERVSAAREVIFRSTLLSRGAVLRSKTC